MAAVMLQVIPSFHPKFSEKILFISANTYKFYIVNKEYYIAHNDADMRDVPST